MIKEEIIMADTATVEQDNNTTEGVQNTQANERTFTQAELDEIIRRHDGKTFAKYADYEELKEKATKYDEAVESEKSELQKATEKAESLQQELETMKKADEVRKIREKVATETGVPANLLYGETEEACKAIADGINAYKLGSTKTVAPNVKDGGETHTPTATKEQIFAIKDEKARIKAIEENIELFN